MKSNNRNLGAMFLALVLTALCACTTHPQTNAFDPPIYAGPVHNLVARAPQVGDVGRDGHVNFVYTPSGWVQL